MTTVAFKDGILAADTQAEDGAGLKTEVQKILVADFFSGGDSYVYRCRLCVACAGVRADGILLYRHLLGVAHGSSFVSARQAVEDLEFNAALGIDHEDQNSNFLVSLSGIPTWDASRTGNLVVKKRIGRVMDDLGPRGFHAMGSGRDFALAAMHLGKTSAEAVALAHEFDSGTGPRLQEVSVWPK